MAKRVAAEVLVNRRRRPDRLPPRDPERGRLVRSAAELCDASRPTFYRLLQGLLRPRPAHRADRGRPRTIALEPLERHGVEPPDGLLQAPVGRLGRATVDRYLAL